MSVPPAPAQAPPELLLAAVQASDAALALIEGEEARVLWSSAGLHQVLELEGAPEGQPLAALLGPALRVEGLHRALRRRAPWGAVLTLQRGTALWVVEARLTPVPGAAPRALLHLRDLTRLHHDPLTTLPHRALLLDRLGQALRQARRDRERVGVLFLDLDRFKEINDTHGHATGDRLLIAVAQRLRGAVRASDTVARLSGDEFAVVLPRLTRPEHATAVGDKLMGVVSAPLRVGSTDLEVQLSVGAAVFPEDGDTPALLLQRADAAMYAAKRGGEGRTLRWQPPPPVD